MAFASRVRLARADELFTARDNADSLKQAVLLMEQLTTREASNYEAWWRLSRLRYYSGDRESDATKKSRLFQAGVEAGKKAVALDDKRVEGHFWYAANEGEYADLKGALQSLGSGQDDSQRVRSRARNRSGF